MWNKEKEREGKKRERGGGVLLGFARERGGREREERSREGAMEW
jgi:hypothetical protein